MEFRALKTFILAAAANHPLANKRDASIEDVLGYNIILTECHVGYSYALIRVPGHEVTVYKQLFWHKNKYITKPMNDFMELIKSNLYA